MASELNELYDIWVSLFVSLQSKQMGLGDALTAYSSSNPCPQGDLAMCLARLFRLRKKEGCANDCLELRQELNRLSSMLKDSHPKVFQDLVNGSKRTMAQTAARLSRNNWKLCYHLFVMCSWIMTRFAYYASAPQDNALMSMEMGLHIAVHANHMLSGRASPATRMERIRQLSDLAFLHLDGHVLHEGAASGAFVSWVFVHFLYLFWQTEWKRLTYIQMPLDTMIMLMGVAVMLWQYQIYDFMTHHAVPSLDASAQPLSFWTSGQITVGGQRSLTPNQILRLPLVQQMSLVVTSNLTPIAEFSLVYSAWKAIAESEAVSVYSFMRQVGIADASLSGLFSRFLDKRNELGTRLIHSGMQEVVALVNKKEILRRFKSLRKLWLHIFQTLLSPMQVKDKVFAVVDFHSQIREIHEYEGNIVTLASHTLQRLSTLENQQINSWLSKIPTPNKQAISHLRLISISLPDRHLWAEQLDVTVQQFNQAVDANLWSIVSGEEALEPLIQARRQFRQPPAHVWGAHLLLSSETGPPILNFLIPSILSAADSYSGGLASLQSKLEHGQDSIFLAANPTEYAPLLRKGYALALISGPATHQAVMLGLLSSVHNRIVREVVQAQTSNWIQGFKAIRAFSPAYAYKTLPMRHLLEWNGSLLHWSERVMKPFSPANLRAAMKDALQVEAPPSIVHLMDNSTEEERRQIGQKMLSVRPLLWSPYLPQQEMTGKNVRQLATVTAYCGMVLPPLPADFALFFENETLLKRYYALSPSVYTTLLIRSVARISSFRMLRAERYVTKNDTDKAKEQLKTLIDMGKTSLGLTREGFNEILMFIYDYFHLYDSFGKVEEVNFADGTLPSVFQEVDGTWDGDPPDVADIVEKMKGRVQTQCFEFLNMMQTSDVFNVFRYNLFDPVQKLYA
jgi:hypothetical protein